MDRTPNPPVPPLAIVGVGCLFPGSADFAGFWARVCGRFDAVRDVPPTHWRAEDYLDADPKAPDRVYTARGGFLDPVPFNPQAFGIPPSNLEATDASQLLGLLVAQQALEDCGYALSEPRPSGGGEEGPPPDGRGPERLGGKKPIDRSRVSVILGVTGTLQLVIPLGARLGHPIWRRALKEAGVSDDVADDVVQRIADGYVPWQENSFPGLLGNVVAGRIANRFDLGGTNCVVDAACASSLSAIHLAAMELATGRSDLVLTGGVDTFNDIFMFTCFSKTPALSPTGNARPFDATGDGTVLGEGLGMVVLKRLDDARRDGDRVYAVLRGVGSSSDGKGGAIYAPRKEGQVEALSNAYRVAGVTPDTIELVEGHGTGTKVGDATEVSALAEVYSRSSRSGPWCAVGSIKSQIGHTKAAAGVAGLLKAAAALYHKVLPPTIKVTEPLEVLRKPGCPLYVNTAERPWLPSPDHPRRAAVSAFGFGGSNFHAVIEEADAAKPVIDWPGDVQLMALAGRSPDELRQRLQAWPTDLKWPDLCRRADESRRGWRPDAEWRLLLVVERDRLDLRATVAKALTLLERGEARGLPSEGIYLGTGPAPGKLGVLFPGQGSQYVGMLREVVCHFPQAFDVFAATDQALAAKLGRRLVDLVYPPPAFTPEAKAEQEAALRATDAAQPALGAVSLGAWRVLEALGVRGDAFAGHSYGELAALCAAGWLGEGDLFALSILRGRLMAEAGSGAMLAVKAGGDAVLGALAEEGIDLVLANKNAPAQTVLSGEVAEVERAAAAFARRGLAAVRLPVAAAFHSPLVAAAREPFARALGDIALTPAKPVWANSTAGPYPDDPVQAKELLAGQLARPVEWVRQVEAMHDAGVRGFVEVGPGGKLAGLVESTLGGRDAFVAALDPTSGKRSGWLDLAGCVAALAARGYPVDLARWDPVSPAVASAKAALNVELSGVNYVKPRAARPAARREAPVNHHPANNGSHKSERPVTSPPPPAARVPSSPGPADPNALSRALEMTRESLAALQQMQERTAALHRQFLDGQEQAHRTVHLLVEQQQRLAQASLGLPVSPWAAPAPAPVSAAPLPALPPPAPRPPAMTTASPPPPAPVAVPEKASPAPAPAAERVLVEVVSEKTGYPAEMLELGMSLDADLGIDSIKRVEILSALQERLPEAPPVRPEHLGTLHTLRDIAAFLGNVPVAAPTAGHAATEAVLVEVVSEKTGYPAEMLELGMSLDADLGIDSIKRVEILSALQERLPEAPPVRPEHLGTLHTLRDIAAFLANGATTSSLPSPPLRGRGAGGEGESGASGPLTPNASPPKDQLRGEPEGRALERGVVHPAPLPSAPRPAVRLPDGSELWLSDDGSSLVNSIADLLGARGYRPRRVKLDQLPGGDAPAGLLLVAPERGLADAWLRDALFAVQRLRNDALLATVSRLDGAFGLGGTAPWREPIDGGLAGLAKTVRQEWPRARAKVIDVSPDLDVQAAAALVVEELLVDGPAEVGVSPRGKVTVTYTSQPAPLTSHVPFQPGDVVVVSGGARGVTAEVAVALAEAFRPTLVLLGRSAEPGPEPEGFAELPDEPAVRREMARRNPGLSPRAIGEQARDLVAAREVRRTLDRVREAGATVLYHSVDVRDEAAVRSVLAEVRRRYGPVRGLVHGAGVLADARIEDKTAAQFDDVYQTKVAGLRALLAAVGDDELRALVLFSSSTARFGRAGQVDYAVANEVLNKLAWQEASRRPGCRVVSFNWGPWDGGMVHDGLKPLFAREGIGLIPLPAGARLLIDELRAGPDGPREVVVLAHVAAPTPSLPPAPPTAFERVLDVAEHPVLQSHVLDGRPVLPAALMLEWLAHAAMVQNPGLAFHGCDDLRVLHGVALDGPPPTLRVGAARATRRDGLFVAPAELRSVRPDGREVLHARADVILVNALPAAPDPPAPPALDRYPLSPEEVYRQGLLFHGPALHAIEGVEGCGEAGLVGVVRAAPPAAEWMRQPLRKDWLTDPLAIDGAFQLAIVWTRERRGAGSLPAHVTHYRQYRRAFPVQGVRVVLTVERAGDRHAILDVDFVDLEGRLVARIEGYECVIDANLSRAFRKNGNHRDTEAQRREADFHQIS